MMWNRKYQEYHTKNRIYCPAQKCDPDRLNEWRIPEPIQVIYRRAFGAPEPGQVPPPPTNDPPRPVQRPRNPTYTEEIDQRQRQERLDEDLARRMQLASLLEPEDDRRARRRADLETWGLGNAGGHFLNENFVQNAANVVMSAFGDANMGRRGERASGRRRRPRERSRDAADAGLPANFLGDASVIGVGPANARP
ncbi:hypothetical protein PRZ48_013224 [Zasmidium cellare]|uniref:Uncharacterized protein n=1 Tax=Zasmidium cellare TaxID=395010 RepID=A0ABR0E406_ZASCE|nr:hypothetical protein PRZ48_013224 [Zasmidium cellare]